MTEVTVPQGWPGTVNGRSGLPATHRIANVLADQSAWLRASEKSPIYVWTLRGTGSGLNNATIPAGDKGECKFQCPPYTRFVAVYALAGGAGDIYVQANSDAWRHKIVVSGAGADIVANADWAYAGDMAATADDLPECIDASATTQTKELTVEYWVGGAGVSLYALQFQPMRYRGYNSETMTA